MAIKPRSLEYNALIFAALYSIVLGILSGLELFRPFDCRIQGLIGIVSAMLIGFLTYPIALRRAQLPWKKGMILYTIFFTIAVLAFWPVIHTVVLLLTTQ